MPENTGVTEFTRDPRPLVRELPEVPSEEIEVSQAEVMYDVRKNLLTPDAGCDTVYSTRMLVRHARKIRWLISQQQATTDGS